MFVPDYKEDVENDHQSTSHKQKSSPIEAGTSSRVSESRDRSPAIAGPSQNKPFHPPKLQECFHCNCWTSHLKRHVIESHINPSFWELQPLNACRKCKGFFVNAHLKNCEPFNMSKHGRHFDDAVKRFVSLVKSCLMVKNEEAMLLAIQRRQLAFYCATFSREKLHVLDAYDRSKGLPHLKNKTAGYPESLNSPALEEHP